MVVAGISVVDIIVVASGAVVVDDGSEVNAVSINTVVYDGLVAAVLDVVVEFVGVDVGMSVDSAVVVVVAAVVDSEFVVNVVFDCDVNTDSCVDVGAVAFDVVVAVTVGIIVDNGTVVNLPVVKADSVVHNVLMASAVVSGGSAVVVFSIAVVKNAVVMVSPIHTSGKVQKAKHGFFGSTMSNEFPGHSSLNPQPSMQPIYSRSHSSNS